MLKVITPLERRVNGKKCEGALKFIKKCHSDVSIVKRCEGAEQEHKLLLLLA